MEVQNIISKPIWWTGTILKVLLCLFLLFDAIMKVIKNQQSVESTMKIGLPESCVQFLGAYILVSTALYINQRTVMMGCLFLLAYLGGAVAITYRAGIGGHPYIFPVVFAILLLLAEFLRNTAVRNVIPLI